MLKEIERTFPGLLASIQTGEARLQSIVNSEMDFDSERVALAALIAKLPPAHDTSSDEDPAFALIVSRIMVAAQLMTLRCLQGCLAANPTRRAGVAEASQQMYLRKEMLKEIVDVEVSRIMRRVIEEVAK